MPSAHHNNANTSWKYMEIIQGHASMVSVSCSIGAGDLRSSWVHMSELLLDHNILPYSNTFLVIIYRRNRPATQAVFVVSVLCTEYKRQTLDTFYKNCRDCRLPCRRCFVCKMLTSPHMWSACVGHISYPSDKPHIEPHQSFLFDGGGSFSPGMPHAARRAAN
jgi:hypothetical protein